jgi:ribosomal protein L11 methyltransferase
MDEATSPAFEIRVGAGLTEDSSEFDRLVGLLYELGTTGFETMVGEKGALVLRAVFPQAEVVMRPDVLAASLRADGFPVESVTTFVYEPVDWSTHWRRHFHPMFFGDLVVVPSWEPIPENAAYSLVLDPSTAFGTGQHATTALCLRAILEHGPERILDVGTGSGILALAALRTGSLAADAVDNDPEALRVARENAELNQLSDRLTLDISLDAFIGPYALVVANIQSGVLVDLAPDLAQRVAEGGRLLLSGILRDQAETVIGAYRPFLQGKIQQRSEDEWVLLEFFRDS